ncbi:MAG: bi-domain-containing oxidoreductase [Thalassospira sp.]|uniref:bi-domain-containing oxidoreductase n=1 Tax=Thalassospira sp. TaxID=1912094 RepID=UPI003A895FDB
MTEMKALLRFPGNRKIALANCPIPTPDRQAILVRTRYSLISPGTEFTQAKQATASLLQKVWQRPDLVALTLKSLRSDGARATSARVSNRLGQPLPMGYCAVGIVEATGETAGDFVAGQRVAIAGMGQANHAEWNTVSRNLACPVPDGVTDRQAAFTTLYALALHAVRQGGTAIGDRVAIVGAGLVGQLVAEIARISGAIVTVIEPDDFRREAATGNGAHAGFATTAEVSANSFDAVYLCAAAKGDHDLINDAAKLCRDRATIICVGDVAIRAERPALFEKELTLKQVRSYGPGRYDPNYEELGQDYPIGYVRWSIKRNMEAALALMADGRLDPSPLITSEIAFAAIADYFAKGSAPEELATLVRYSTASDIGSDDLGKSEQMASRPEADVRIGLIGAGNYLGGSLLPILRKCTNSQVIACCSSDGISAMAVARKVGRANAVSSAQDILDDNGINTVLITTRHDSHADLAASALDAGKHVWLEKPIAIDHAGLEQLRTCMSGGSAFMIGHNRRYADMSNMLRTALPDGPKHFRYRVRFSALPDKHWLNHSHQGGRAIGEVSHFIDLILSLCGADLVELTCTWINRLRGDSIWRMRFADCSVGEVSYQLTKRREPKEVLEVDAPGFDAKLKDWRKLEINGKTVQRLWFGQDKGQANALDAFITSIRSGTRHPLMPGLAAEIDLMTSILDAANQKPGYCAPA